MEIREESKQITFQNTGNHENLSVYSMQMPEVQSDGIWDPVIRIKYEVKVFD